LNPEEVTAAINLLSIAIPALVGAYKAIAGNVSGAATVEQLLADADSKWAQIAANADASIAADKPAL
jgi:hypothetical protein